MNEEKLKFNNEGLVVDWIALNIQDLIDPEPIGIYLSESLGFNSFVKESHTEKRKSLIFRVANQHKAIIVKSSYSPSINTYWTGLTVRFSGEDAAHFYSLMKNKQVDWGIFDLTKTSLGRFDLHYFRESKITDLDSLDLFLKASREMNKQRAAYVDENSKGRILKVGSRDSANYYRVYEKKNGLEFELEMKKTLVKSFEKLFFLEDLSEFEMRVTQEFYKQSRKVAVLSTCYTDWLLVALRKIFQDQRPFDALVSSYIENEVVDSVSQKENFFKFLQFLSFVRGQEASKAYIEDQIYYLIEFSLTDFLKFIGENKESTYKSSYRPYKSSYHRTKSIKFFSSLQDLQPLVQRFSSSKFRSSVMFPYITLEKIGRSWSIKLAIGEELFFYRYPFFFPTSFLTYKGKYDMEIKLKLIESFCAIPLEKRFLLEEFLHQFLVPNSDLVKIKTLLIESLKTLQVNQIVASDFKIFYKDGSSENVSELNLKNIKKSKIIYFFEKIT